MLPHKILLTIFTTLFVITSLSFTVFADSSSSGNILKADMLFGPDDNLDPAYKYTGWYLHEAGIYETLFSLDEDMNLVPTLATGYDQVSDTEYRISLKEGVTFHDGTPVDADAVVYSLQRVMDSSNSRHGELDFIASVQAADDKTVVINTKQPHSPTIATLVDPLVSIVKPDVDLNTTPVGTGPFKFESFEKGVSLSVVRNDDYWGEKAKLDGAVLYFVSDSMTRAMQLEGGDVDIARGLPQSEVAGLKENQDLEILSMETMRENLIYVNMNKAPFNDVNGGLKVSNSGGIKLSTCQFPGLKPRGHVDDRYGGVPHVARFIQRRIEHQRDRQTDWTQPCDGAEVSELTGSPIAPEAIQKAEQTGWSQGIHN